MKSSLFYLVGTAASVVGTTGSGQIQALRNFRNVFGLWSFRPVDHFEFNFLTLDQRFIAVAGDSTVVDEDVLLTGLLYKAVALGIVEPFDLTSRFRHLS